MNRTVLTGHLSKDLEIRKTQSGKSVMEFDLAVKRDRKDQSGNYLADFIRVQCWEQRAEYLNQYAGKGYLIAVSGRIETSSYVNNQGNKVYSTYVVADSVEILKAPEKKQAPQETGNITISQSPTGTQIDGIEPDELPFF